MWRFVALLLALVAGVAAAVWYYRAAPTQPPVSVVVRNDDRWLDDLLSRSPKDVEKSTAELEQQAESLRGTAADARAREHEARQALRRLAEARPWHRRGLVAEFAGRGLL